MLLALALLAAVPAPPPILPARQVDCAGSSEPACKAAVAFAGALVARDRTGAELIAAPGTTVRMLPRESADGAPEQLGSGKAALRSLVDRIEQRAEPAKSFLCLGVPLATGSMPVRCLFFVGDVQREPALTYLTVMDFRRGGPTDIAAAIVPREFATGATVDCAAATHRACDLTVSFGAALARREAAALARFGTFATTVGANGDGLGFPAPIFPNTAAGWRDALAAVHPPAAQSTARCYIGRRLNTQAEDADTGLCEMTAAGGKTAWLTVLLKLKAGQLVDVGLLRMSHD